MRTEGDCLKLLRRANLPLETLQEILSDRAARKFHAVRRALAAHPRTPRTEALALVRDPLLAGPGRASRRTRASIRRSAGRPTTTCCGGCPRWPWPRRWTWPGRVGRGTLLVLRLDPDPRVLVVRARQPVRDRGRRHPGGRFRPNATAEILSRDRRHTRAGELRPAVRSALLRNPVLPPSLALSLLTRASLEDLARTARLARARRRCLKACAAKSPCGEGRRGLASNIPESGRLTMGETPSLTFGEELRRERLIRDVSLEEISTATKISVRLLTALEDERSVAAAGAGLHARVHPRLLATTSVSIRTRWSTPTWPTSPRTRSATSPGRRRAGCAPASCAGAARRRARSSSA